MSRSNTYLHELLLLAELEVDLGEAGGDLFARRVRSVRRLAVRAGARCDGAARAVGGLVPVLGSFELTG